MKRRGFLKALVGAVAGVGTAGGAAAKVVRPIVETVRPEEWKAPGNYQRPISDDPRYDHVRHLEGYYDDVFRISGFDPSEKTEK